MHALTVRGIGLAWWEGAPIPVARRADSHCTCCGSTQASVARSRIMMSVPPLPTLALGRSSKHALQRASRAARSARLFDMPTTKRQRAQVIGGKHSRRPGAQRPRHRRPTRLDYEIARQPRPAPHYFSARPYTFAPAGRRGSATSPRRARWTASSLASWSRTRKRWAPEPPGQNI